MIIDGVEVLYTMRNGKIVDPNIPMDGLVCYLNTRGKYNTDVYRNTLLDLSGNGNHGTLQNFSFTEESGYVKDLSGGTSGLKFDGVDDSIRKNITTDGEYTFYIKFTPPKSYSAQMRFFENATFMFYFNFDAGKYLFSYKTIDNITKYYNLNRMYTDEIKVVITLQDNTLTLDTNGSKSTFSNVLSDFRFIQLGNSSLQCPVMTFNNMMIWNRALTDTEITKLMEVE